MLLSNKYEGFKGMGSKMARTLRYSNLIARVRYMKAAKVPRDLNFNVSISRMAQSTN